MPTVSVVIPCYNLGVYVDEAIESVLAQTFRDFEILVIDDGSTDPGTCATLARLEKPKTRVIRSEHGGLSAARNLGIRHAAAPYISALDADDQFAPTWLERAVSVLDADANVAFVSHWLETFGDESWTWKPDRADLTVLLDRNVVNGAALFRRWLVDAVGGFDESMRDGCEDWEFWLRVVEAGYRGAIIPEVLYRYRRRADSMSRRMKAANLEPRLLGDIISKHRQAYVERVRDLVLRREWALARMWLAEDEARLELSTLGPALEERRGELEAAEEEVARRGAGVQANTPLTEQTQRAAAAERAVQGMRSSLSWRLTGPLRRLYERVGLGSRASYDR